MRSLLSALFITAILVSTTLFSTAQGVPNESAPAYCDALNKIMLSGQGFTGIQGDLKEAGKIQNSYESLVAVPGSMSAYLFVPNSPTGKKYLVIRFAYTLNKEDAFKKYNETAAMLKNCSWAIGDLAFSEIDDDDYHTKSWKADALNSDYKDTHKNFEMLLTIAQNSRTAYDVQLTLSYK